MSEGKADTTAARFADNIRARREALAKSQEDIAQGMRDLGFANFRQQTVAEIESGRRQVKLEEAYSLARVLGHTVDGMVRPAGLAQKASVILDAAGDLITAARQEAHWAIEREQAHRRLDKALKAAAGNEDKLAEEVAVARRALKTAGLN